MRRIIGTIGATLAIVAVVATPAAAQGRDRDRDRDREDARMFYATSVAGETVPGEVWLTETNGIVTAVLEGTTVKLKSEAADPTPSVNCTDEFSNQPVAGGGKDTVDVAGLDNIGRTTSVTLDAPIIGDRGDEGTLLVDFPASADEQRNQFIDGNLNPGTPMVVGSAYTN
jgi:hypothetical protein